MDVETSRVLMTQLDVTILFLDTFSIGSNRELPTWTNVATIPQIRGSRWNSILVGIRLYHTLKVETKKRLNLIDELLQNENRPISCVEKECILTRVEFILVHSLECEGSVVPSHSNAFGSNRKFTHLIVLSEKSKVCNGMLISHLRPSEAGNGLGGPTAFFKVSNVIPSTDVPNNGSATSHVPELNLHGFTTRLGHRAGRFLGSLFPHNAQFRGRQVATFHNQRDFIFVRHHRYVFEEGTREVHADSGKKKTKARLQELGPRFTLKMRWLQEGTFDTQFGEYEWFHKRKEMDTTRRKFHL
ncbi:hypothetical protein ACHAW5_005838 [Stephanodiscus triporus]|uniref:Brix domain-containing protein n=1 Tax=Stephanodiscus triporus TaxID=2934178 RepID=A0ABD3PAW7_9STRA